MFRVGVIGTGWVAQERHIPSFQAIPGVEVAGVYDRREDQARQVAHRFGIPFAARRREDLLDADLDAVSIATSPWSHAEHTCMALESGLHVFCEKPMALGADEASAMAEAASAAAKTLTVSHNFLYARSSQLARRYLGADPGLSWVGATQLSSAARRLPEWYRDLPGGLLFDEVPHLLYLLRDWCGPLSLARASATWREDGHPAVVQALFSGHVPAQATMIFGAPLSEWHVTLVGRVRVVDLDLFRDIAVRLPSDQTHSALDIARTSAKAVADHGVGFAASGLALVRGRQRWGHDRLIRAFVRAARGLGPNPVPLPDALDVVRMSDELLDGIGARKRATSPPPRP